MSDHAHRDVVGHNSADDQYQETPGGAGYEHTDASVSIIVKFILWLVAAAVVIHIGLALLFDAFAARRVERAEPRFPLAAREEPLLPPEPRLQRFPREDILSFRTREEAVLQNYAWIDKGTGSVRIPIQDAMRLMLEKRMLPSRTPGPDSETVSVPADSSGGRTLVPARQR
jgi:hypothetical protein